MCFKGALGVLQHLTGVLKAFAVEKVALEVVS